MSTAPARRIPLNTFAISFGLAGLAEIWSVASTRLGWTPVLSWALWGVATIVWLVLLAAHLTRGARTRLPLAAQLRDPAQGPIAALVPVFAMLLGTTLIPAQPVVGRVLVLAGIIAAALYAGWLLALWMRGDRPIDALHGGYFLPTVAAGFIGATAAHAADLPVLAYGSFGVAILFWVVIQTLLLARLATRPALPGPLVPSLAIMAAPPAVGGIAWFELTDGRFDHVQEALAGLAVLMLLIQLFFIRLCCKNREA